MVLIKGDDNFIAQAVSTSSTTSVAMSNAAPTWVDLSGLSVSITPSSASSKILVTASVCAGQGPSNPYAIWFRLLRDGTPVGVGNSSGKEQYFLSFGHFTTVWQGREVTCIILRILFLKNLRELVNKKSLEIETVIILPRLKFSG